MSDDAQRYKRDGGKQRWSLLPTRALRQLLYVAEYGARKYKERSYLQVPEARQRYWESVGRHYHDLNEAIQERGFGVLLTELSDDGLPHLTQLGFDVLIMIDLALMESPP